MSRRVFTKMEGGGGYKENLEGHWEVQPLLRPMRGWS